MAIPAKASSPEPSPLTRAPARSCAMPSGSAARFTRTNDRITPTAPAPQRESDRAPPIVPFVREPERAELLDLEPAHDVAVANDDLAGRHLHLDRRDSVARILPREVRCEVVDLHVHVEVLLEDLRAGALLPVGPPGG